MNSYHYLSIGDKLVRSKGLVEHYGIVVGANLVAENNYPNGVQIVSLEKFLNGKPILRHVPFNGTQQARNLVVSTVYSKLGMPYNLAAYNCEHFVNDVLTGKSSSTQVRNGILLSSLLVTAIIVARK